MERKQENNIVEQMFLSITKIDIDNFEGFISQFLSRKSDKKHAIEELENFIAQLSNKTILLSLYLKQRYILGLAPGSQPIPEEECFTKRSLAKKYRVTVRTVTNWIRDGLACEEIGGVIRITQSALKEFVAKAKSKKFRWKSIVHPKG